MGLAAVLAALIAAGTGLAVQDSVQQTDVPQTGVVQRGVPQMGVPQQGVPQTGNPQRPSRVIGGYRPPVTVIVGDPGFGNDVIAFPGSVNLPNPAPGLVWRQVGQDAVLYDVNNASIVEVRSHWFG